MQEKVIIGTGDVIERENLVEFRLLYQGILLPSGGSNRRAAEKHEIRIAFHPQLRRLWGLQKGLRQYAEQVAIKAAGLHPNNPHPRDASWVEEGLVVLGKNWNRNGFNFVPLVALPFALRCKLDILLLRPNESKYIFQQGDIDGHLKTLIDALRIPREAQEVGEATPAADENPFFCLLENDNLISEVHVVTDQLLVLPNEREVKANDAFVTIHIQINHLGGSPFDRWFD